MSYTNTAPAQVVTGNAWLYAPHHLKDADFGNEFGFHEPEGALDAPDMMHPVNLLRTGRALFHKDQFKDCYMFDYDALGNFVQCVGELDAPDCVPAGSIKLMELDNFPYWIYCTVAWRE